MEVTCRWKTYCHVHTVSRHVEGEYEKIKQLVMEELFQALYTMDQSYRRPMYVQRDVRVLNQKEHTELQHKLNLLEKQYRYTRKMLQQRREVLIQEKRRVLMVKRCEPNATVNIAMKEIDKHKNMDAFFRGIHTSDSARFCSSKFQYHNNGLEPKRSTSAPLPSLKDTGSVRHNGTIQCGVSFMQLKNIATIDSIAEKERIRVQQQAKEEMEKLKLFQREVLHKRVKAFIQSLENTEKVELLLQTPQRNVTVQTETTNGICSSGQ